MCDCRLNLRVSFLRLYFKVYFSVCFILFSLMLVLLSLRFRFLFHDVCFSKCLEIWGCLLCLYLQQFFHETTDFPDRQTDSSLLFSPSVWSISGITVIVVGILPCILDSDFSLLFSPSWLVFAEFLKIFQWGGAFCRPSCTLLLSNNLQDFFLCNTSYLLFLWNLIWKGNMYSVFHPNLSIKTISLLRC